VAQVLVATEASRRRRAIIPRSAWRPESVTGNRGGLAGPSCAVQQLHAMYASEQPPPINVIRQPQVSARPVSPLCAHM
jgi:hypothetical protein